MSDQEFMPVFGLWSNMVTTWTYMSEPQIVLRKNEYKLRNVCTSFLNSWVTWIALTPSSCIIAPRYPLLSQLIVKSGNVSKTNGASSGDPRNGGTYPHLSLYADYFKYRGKITVRIKIRAYSKPLIGTVLYVHFSPPRSQRPPNSPYPWEQQT